MSYVWKDLDRMSEDPSTYWDNRDVFVIDFMPSGWEFTYHPAGEIILHRLGSKKEIPKRVCFCCNIPVEQNQPLCDFCASEGHCKENGLPGHPPKKTQKD